MALKICSRCNSLKTEEDFYICRGIVRSECKPCTIKKNVNYQKLKRSWMSRFIDEEEQKSYMLNYYAEHKDKFAEYRRKFKEKYPGYHKDYRRARKKMAARVLTPDCQNTIQHRSDIWIPKE